MNQGATGEKPQYLWEVGTAYDFFTSLVVLHQPDRYGLRGNWAAGVRSRLPLRKRELLRTAVLQARVWPIPWLTALPLPQKDAVAILQHMASIPAAKRLPLITQPYLNADVREILHSVLARGAWVEADKELLRETYRQIQQREGKKRKITDEDLAAQLDAWANPETFGADYLAALETYYEVFFQEDEARIRTALAETAVAAQSFAEQLSLPELLETLSQGLSFDYADLSKVRLLRLVPSFWSTPLSLFISLGEPHQGEWLFLFGGRPAEMSLVPGEAVPDLLHNTLKALADPTRLRILHYLSAEPLTPAELARRLRLRPPTVIHHLDALRLARLVHLRLGADGRRYTARREAVNQVSEMLADYLAGEK